MSTRGCIARIDGEGFTGRYHHWDSYPRGLGATLFKLRNEHFRGDTDATLRFLIDDHPAGWSTINNKDFTLEPGFAMEGPQPLCYCHGERSEKAQVVTQANASGSGVEYAYCFPPNGKRMLILSSYRANGEKMVGWFGGGDPESTWSAIADIDLDGPEPDWKGIET